ncbi:uncharacterized protein LAESUDRAFT_722004 [Laetiporus sulphureus 93-53]|uniref:Uncharacterized protein n=1 Tax=Laetiporus sulphureus 93-53 TaxID=1314785 RepID=A0A165G5H1_9APHY|nr:uncharacterized protein LAESUDRAFT_722004 [Laetiporus sulphureus 93-53]KZT09854.1 hypothetical protein LAESUDRAFT_722004 [Laetiporus sulphureus 93-53]
MPHASYALGVNAARHTGLHVPSPLAMSKTTRSKEQTHRRKRGDTIRASDFIRPTLLPSAADDIANTGSSAQTNGSGKTQGGTRTRRTRSGTVTLAGPASRATDVQVQGEKPKANSPLRTHKRHHEGWPTIRMRIDNSPLRTIAGEDEDELLLKAGSSVH